MAERRGLRRMGVVGAVLVAVAVLGLAVVAAPVAAQNDEGSTDQPADDGNSDEAPPADDGNTDEAPPADGGGSDRTTEEWLVLIILGVAALAAVLGLAGMFSNRRKSMAAAQSDLEHHVAEAVSGSRWVHDSGTIDVMRQTDPDLLRSTWSGVRLRMGGIEEQMSRLEAGTSNRNLAKKVGVLAQSLVSLRGAIDSYVSLKNDPEAHNAEELISGALDTVTTRRAELEAAIAPVASTIT